MLHLQLHQKPEPGAHRHQGQVQAEIDSSKICQIIQARQRPQEELGVDKSHQVQNSRLVDHF